ncbi:uncharacterized protein LOC110399220 [Numida meleagris]|uniref:uncharacterized protein LOC110399220 n=1 Tax=Numida meleagris TaxID=8996 RepID=UPI000B3DD327|nr:uncharacterized protein LOC110399220 [Numida meleagris]
MESTPAFIMLLTVVEALRHFVMEYLKFQTHNHLSCPKLSLIISNCLTLHIYAMFPLSVLVLVQATLLPPRSLGEICPSLHNETLEEPGLQGEPPISVQYKSSEQAITLCRTLSETACLYCSLWRKGHQMKNFFFYKCKIKKLFLLFPSAGEYSSESLCRIASKIYSKVSFWEIHCLLLEVLQRQLRKMYGIYYFFSLFQYTPGLLSIGKVLESPLSYVKSASWKIGTCYSQVFVNFPY